MAIDPRSIIGEILSRRPDLRRTYAPQAQALGIQIAGLKPAVETRRRLEAANAWRAGGPPMPGLSGIIPGQTPAAPLTGLSPDEMALPFNGTNGDPNSLRSMAERGDPIQAPGFRSRLSDARMLQGSGTPMPGLAIAGTNPTAQVQGQLPSNFMSPGNLPRPRPYESPIAARPEGPPSGFPAAPPLQSMVRPEGPPGGFPAATPFGGNMPMPRQTAALGSGERSPLPGLPRARPPEMGPPMPSVAQSTMPGSETMGPPSPLASRFGDQSQLASGAFRGAPPRPPSTAPGGETFASPSALASRLGSQPPLPGGAFTGGPPPPMATGPTPQQLDAAKDMVRQMASLPQVAPPRSLQPIETTPTSTMPNPLQRSPLDLAAGAGATAQPLGSTGMPFAAIPPTPASVAQRTADVLGPLPPGAGTGAPVRSVQQPLIGVPPASGTVPPVGPVPGQDLPAPPASPPVGVPSMLASVGPPNPARMEVVANYNQPPPGMDLPPGVTLPDVGRLGFGDTNVDPSKAPVHRYGSNTGKYVGAGLGALKGLAGGPVGAAVGGVLGYKGGKRVGGLADRDFGLGARFSNPNYAQGVVANPPPIMGVPAITPPVDIPISQPATGGIFGQGMRGLGQKAQGILAAVKSGAMSIKDAAAVSGMSESRIRDSLGSIGSSSGGRGMGSGGWGGGGQGGNYGGYGGSRIGEGIGGAYRNR